MGVSAAVGLVAVSGFVSSNNASHQATNANTRAAEEQDQANQQIAAANKQQNDNLNKQAQATAGAQARVRAIANPDGNSIMTSPLGAVGDPNSQSKSSTQTNLNSPPAAPGTITTPGKSTIGG